MENKETYTDENLMDCLAKGDHQAFCILVRRHTERFYVCAYRVCNDQNDAEDAVQEAFLKIWKNPSVWKAGKGAKFTTWFYRVVNNAAIDIMRKKKNHSGSDVLEFMADDKDMQDEALDKTQKQKNLEKAIDALPERQKQALNLCFYDGFTNKEAAEMMGVGIKALESLLMRAKNTLKDALMKQGVIEKEKRYGY